MASCVFFGHRSFDYSGYRENLTEIIGRLIHDEGVTVFYNGFRGEFDRVCAEMLQPFREKNRDIRHIMALSYHPGKDFYLSKMFDETVYLITDNVPPRFAISRTNRLLAELADFVISGVFLHSGGAYTAVRHAKYLNKKIIGVSHEIVQ